MAGPESGLVECHGDESSILNGAITITNNKTRVTMLNPTADPLTVPRGEIVAHISALPAEEDLLTLLPATDSNTIAAVTQCKQEQSVETTDTWKREEAVKNRHYQKKEDTVEHTDTRQKEDRAVTAQNAKKNRGRSADLAAVQCHLCIDTTSTCINCPTHPTAAVAQVTKQASSCVTNASWGPRPTTARTALAKHMPAVKETINKLSFKEKQLHLRKNLKIPCPDKQWAKQYWALVDSFHDIFSDSEDDLGHTNTIEHNIRLKSQDPIHIKQFRIPFSQRQFIENKVNHLIKQNVLEESTSPYNTPIFAIPKKPVPGQPQGYRLIQDLRAINEHSLTDKYNLADIKECMDKVGTRNAKVFSSLDLTSGFFQISIKPEARPYTAFTIPGKGKYQWARVCLGLHGAPSTFAKLMSLVMAYHKQ